VKAVFFDFAGTLFDDRALRDVHLRQLRFVAGRAGVADATDEELRAAYRVGMHVAYPATATRPGYAHRTLFAGAFRATAEALGGSIDDATADEAVDRQYRATIDEAVLRPDCRSTLEALRRLGRHVQIVSNIDDEQLRPMVERLALTDLVDAVTSSEEAGSCKPDPGIYRLALRKAGVAPEAVLFVGDSLEHDVQGPGALGMRTAWLSTRDVSPGAVVRPDHVVRSLAEVLPIVEAA
jgi:2-haloalkanoic acid dehalogenase type II